MGAGKLRCMDSGIDIHDIVWAQLGGHVWSIVQTIEAA